MTLAPEVPVWDEYEHHYPILFLNQAQATIRRRGCCNKAVMYLNKVLFLLETEDSEQGYFLLLKGNIDQFH